MNKVHKYSLLAIFIGVITFFILYGSTPLDVQNDSWIMAGYDETDIIQHYSGWLAFRNSDWSFPLGIASKMATEEGTIISYTDSIPWVAIIFKACRSFLPETFQYFGIYILLCYILQSIAAFLIIYTETGKEIYSLLGSILFCFAPIQMERALRHTALGSQWLVLFAILLFLRHRKKQTAKHYVGFFVLELLAIGIHPYFLPMIAAFGLICVMIDLMEKELNSILWFLLSLVGTYFCGCILGVLGNNIETSRWGYGYYSMNLNAVINPTSCGNYTWSAILGVRPQTLGNYDGFNYLGVGILIAFFAVFLWNIISVIKSGIKVDFKRNIWLVLAFIALIIFAITNVVTFDDRILLEIPIPQFLKNLCGIFRASSRLFYPVYYYIYIYVIVGIWRATKKAHLALPVIMLLLVIGVQLFDLHSCILEKHERLLETSQFASMIDDDDLNAIATGNKQTLLDQFDGDRGELRTIAVWSLKNRLSTLFSTAVSGDYTKSEEKSVEIAAVAKATGNMQDSIVVTTEYETVLEYLQHENIAYKSYGSCYFIYHEE